MTEREREAAFAAMIESMRAQVEEFWKRRATSQTPCQLIAAKFRGDGAAGVLS
jgi:hypothetical protein